MPKRKKRLYSAKKEQAALEYLVTYGWAILVVLVAIAGLAYFGVFSSDKFIPSKCILPPGISCLDFKVENDRLTGNGKITLRVQNSLGEDISINSVAAANCGTLTTSVPLANGEAITLYVDCTTPISTSKYNEQINITYASMLSGITHILKGDLTSKVSGEIQQVNASQDTIPPFISNGQPTGTLVAGTTQTTLSLTTNEAATCKYSASSGQSYASMTSTFTTTGATSHSTLITGLTNGTSYTRYVRCQDQANNANTNDYTISFSVANGTVSDTTPPAVSITSPSNLATVSGTIAVTATATDNIAVAGVQFKLDNVNIGLEDTTSPYSLSWNTSTAADGLHSLTATARDTSNNLATSSIVSVTVDNSVQSLGNTYYLSTSGSDTNPGTSLQPWATFSKAWTVMQPGDTLIVKDGTYTQSISPTISSSPGLPITIMAENDGGAIIDGGNVRPTISIIGTASYQPQYLTIIGFHARNSAGAVLEVAGFSDASRAHHIEIKRVSGRDSGTADGSVAVFGLYTEDNLMEDSWFWGKARTIVTNYGHYPEPPPHTYRNIFRRVIARFDGTTAILGQNVFTNYGADDSICENCISFDHAPAVDPYGAFRNRPGASNNRFLGCIALNVGNFYPFDIGDETVNITDCIAINSSQQNLVRRQSPSTLNIDRSTFIGSSGTTFTGYGTLTVKNSLFKDCSGASAATMSYSHWDNCGVTSGTNPSSGSSGLLYLTRIEDGSPIDGTGEGGVDRGANILKRYVNGVLTQENLWPWPNEARIKAEMCDSAYLTSIGRTGSNTPGWCASGKTLTQYIWEYLGNPSPYGASQPTDTTPPLRSNAQVNSLPNQTVLSSSSTTATISLSTNENANCRYHTSPGQLFSSMTAFTTTGTLSHSTSIVVSSGNSYTHYIKCQDTATNTNTDDYIISFSVASPSTWTIYYMSPSGSDTNNGLSETTPFKTFVKAFATMAPGDELVLLDGTYSAAAGTGYINYNDGSCLACNQTKSGLSLSQPTYVHAKNPGNVIVDGGTRKGLFIGRSFRKDSYIKVEGIIFEGGGLLYNTDHIIVKNSGFHTLINNGGSTIFGIGVNDHNQGNTNNLIEDVFIWGEAQKAALNYRSNNNVWRRIFIRHDGCDPAQGNDPCNSGKWPASGISLYNSQGVYFENIILVDSLLYPGNYASADFTHTQHDNPVGEQFGGPNYWFGDISLNSGRGCTSFSVDFANDNTETVRDFVCWNPALWGVNSQPGSASCSPNCPRNSNYKSITTQKSFRVRDITGIARDIISVDNPSGWCINVNSFSAITNLNVFGCGTNYNEVSCTGAECHTTDPRSDGPTPSLKYLPRIEPGSKLSTLGSDGGPIGAEIVAYGTSGSISGDSGVASRQSLSDLWPWPNEALIIQKICTQTSRPSYGLCGAYQSGKSITQYIWEYLGNPCPVGIC